MKVTRALLLATLMSALAAASCHSSSPPARSAGNCAEVGAKTGVAGAKTGVKTGAEGVKTFGRAVGGFVEGGSDEARREWQEGKKETKRTAHEGADETKRASGAPDCP
jgi:hypothetical protein